MARARRKMGDDAYNARRRYYRSAERYLKKAETTSGTTSERYRALARKDLEEALATYDASAPKQKISKPIRDLAEKMNINLDVQRGDFIASTEKERAKAIERSTKRLESNLNDVNARRDQEARIILSNPTISRRIIGGFVDVWRDRLIDDNKGVIDRSRIFPLLFEYFKVNSYADLLEKVENIVGDKLYLDEDSESIYETVKILIQTNVSNYLAAL